MLANRKSLVDKVPLAPPEENFRVIDCSLFGRRKWHCVSFPCHKLPVSDELRLIFCQVYAQQVLVVDRGPSLQRQRRQPWSCDLFRPLRFQSDLVFLGLSHPPPRTKFLEGWDFRFWVVVIFQTIILIEAWKRDWDGLFFLGGDQVRSPTFGFDPSPSDQKPWPLIHTGRATRRKTNGTCWCEWECPHCTQATSKDLHSNLRARVLCGLGLNPNLNTPPSRLKS